MIPIETLRAVTTIVAHQNGPGSPCPDGVASAIILRDALPDAAVTFASHDEAGHLEPRPGMLFCDVTPSAATAAAFVDAGAIVLDHHRTARSVVEMFGPLGVFADENERPGVSGALLAFREVWRPLAFDGGQRPRNHGTQARGANELERLAFLAGVRDTWQRSSEWWAEACDQAAALVFWPWEAWPINPYGQTRENLAMAERLAIGPVLSQKRARDTRKAILEAWRYTTRRGTRVAIVSTRETSDVAEELGASTDLVLGFSFLRVGSGPLRDGGERMIVSTRSRGAFDCGEFCKANGGGGHTRAAGFAVDLATDDLQPYTMLARVLEAWRCTAVEAPATIDADDLVSTELCSGVLVRERRGLVERRAAILRQCALLSRAWLEGYERKMPPLERRTHRDLDAQAQHAWRVAASIGRLVASATMFGGMRPWSEAVEAVAALSFDEVQAALMAAPLPLYAPAP